MCLYDIITDFLESQNRFLALNYFEKFLPGLSVDCVIFGFHENELKILLLKMNNINKWAVPGGFVKKEEVVDDAATRILEERTGLKNIFLEQFHLFGNLERHNTSHVNTLVKDNVIPPELEDWFQQRFVTVGYFALVEFSRVEPTSDIISEKCEWISLNDLPNLILDHKKIIQKGLEALRNRLRSQPIGRELLPEKFTMTELRTLYETILDEKLDRGNFQRKILSYGFLKRLNETRKGGAHKAPYLYTFNDEKYNQSLAQGFSRIW